MTIMPETKTSEQQKDEAKQGIAGSSDWETDTEDDADSDLEDSHNSWAEADDDADEEEDEPSSWDDADNQNGNGGDKETDEDDDASDEGEDEQSEGDASWSQTPEYDQKLDDQPEPHAEMDEQQDALSQADMDDLNAKIGDAPVKDAKIKAPAKAQPKGFNEAAEVSKSLPDGVSMKASGYDGKYKGKK